MRVSATAGHACLGNDLGELIGEELLSADDDLGGYSWGFPGGGYTVTITS